MGIGLTGLQGIGGVGGGGGYGAPRPRQYNATPSAGLSPGSSPSVGMGAVRQGGDSGGDMGGLSQLKMATTLGKYGAGAMGDTELAGQFGTMGQGLGYMGALNSVGNILQGKGGVGDYTNTGKTAYDLYNQYQAAQAASEAAAAGGETAAGASGASGGEAAAGAGMGGGMAFTGAIGAMIAYGAARDAHEAKAHAEGSSRTYRRLLEAGVSPTQMGALFNPSASILQEDYERGDQGLQMKARPEWSVDPDKAKALFDKYPQLYNTTGLHDVIGGSDFSAMGSQLKGLPMTSAQPQIDAAWKAYYQNQAPARLGSGDDSGG